MCQPTDGHVAAAPIVIPGSAQMLLICLFSVSGCQFFVLFFFPLLSPLRLSVMEEIKPSSQSDSKRFPCFYENCFELSFINLAGTSCSVSFARQSLHLPCFFFIFVFVFFPRHRIWSAQCETNSSSVNEDRVLVIDGRPRGLLGPQSSQRQRGWC